jgi:hypothetical protein
MSRNEPVWMHHDELDRTIQAVRSQVPYLGAAGWVEVDPPSPPEPKPKPAKQESKPSGRSRPRPSSKESD